MKLYLSIIVLIATGLSAGCIFTADSPYVWIWHPALTLIAFVCVANLVWWAIDRETGIKFDLRGIHFD